MTLRSINIGSSTEELVSVDVGTCVFYIRFGSDIWWVEKYWASEVKSVCQNFEKGEGKSFRKSCPNFFGMVTQTAWHVLDILLL